MMIDSRVFAPLIADYIDACDAVEIPESTIDVTGYIAALNAVRAAADAIVDELTP